MTGAAKRHWWPRRTPVQQGGTLVVDASLEHRCRPPGCHEHAGEWVVDHDKRDRYPEGSVWRCDCGDHYLSTMNNGPYGRRGVWLSWLWQSEPWLQRHGYLTTEADYCMKADASHADGTTG